MFGGANAVTHDTQVYVARLVWCQGHMAAAAAAAAAATSAVELRAFLEECVGESGVDAVVSGLAAVLVADLEALRAADDLVRKRSVCLQPKRLFRLA